MVCVSQKAVIRTALQKARGWAFWCMLVASVGTSAAHAQTAATGSTGNTGDTATATLEALSRGHQALASDPSLARELYDTLEASYQDQPQDMKWRIDFLGAKIRYLEGDTQGNIVQFQQLMDQPLPNTLAIEVSTYLAGAYSLRNQFELAFETLNEAVSRIDDSTSIDVQMEALARAAALYELGGGYSEAHDYGVRLHAIATEAGSKKFICRSGYYIAKGLFGTKNYQQAERQFLATVEDCKATGEGNAVRFVEQDLARNWLEMQKTDEALALLLDLSRQISPSNYWAIGVAKNKFLLAKAYWQKKAWIDAIASGSDALQYAQEIDYPLATREASYVLGLSYSQLGEFEKAYENLVIHLEASKLVTDETQARALAYQQSKYDAQEKARQIAQLENENRMLALEQALRQSERRTFLIIAVLAAILLILVVLRVRKQRTQFRVLSETDGLTGVSNRYHIMAAGQKLIDECQKRHCDVGVILFDLDHFKKINDDFGHPAGDWVLKTVANTCKNRLRKEDMLGRYGGEEFIVILPDISLDTLEQKAEMLRTAIEGIDTAGSGASFPVTASFGVSHLQGRSKATTLSVLVKEADDTLYSAKAAGRNRVETHTSGAAH